MYFLILFAFCAKGNVEQIHLRSLYYPDSHSVNKSYQ